jgi:hypothetical protein
MAAGEAVLPVKFRIPGRRALGLETGERGRARIVEGPPDDLDDLPIAQIDARPKHSGEP